MQPFLFRRAADSVNGGYDDQKSSRSRSRDGYRTGILMNTMLQSFSSTAVAVMGVCNRIHGLATLPPNGVNNALIPIVAYNYGARSRERIRQTILWAFIYSFGMMAAVLLVLELFPGGFLHCSTHRKAWLIWAFRPSGSWRYPISCA